MDSPIFFNTKQSESWMNTLNHIGEYDCYHLPQYHQLSDDLFQESGVLIVYTEGDKEIAFPLLLRPVSQVPGLDEFEWLDATSVYGYPGPIVTPEAADDPAFIQKFQMHLSTTLAELRVIAVFSRMSPLLRNHRWVDGLGDIIQLGETVSVDLTIPSEVQVASYRKSHRYEIRRARRDGIRVYRDVTWSRYDNFVQLYLETMHRLAADKRYFFDIAYFDGLRDALGDRLHLFVAELNGNVCSASLFIHTNNIVQYHLSASADKYLKHAPSKLIIDEARKWGQSVGAQWLHLGGGVGSQEDNLFRFKAGFSPIRHKFYIWKWVIQPTVYMELTQKRHRWLTDHGNIATHSEFFPTYRIFSD